MKNISKGELIELIKNISSRERDKKPILIYNSFHSGPDLYLALLWQRQYGESYDSIPDKSDWYDSDQCKFFVANMHRYNQEFIEWCLSWKKEKNKPVLILLEKSVKDYNESGAEVSAFMEIDAEKRILSLRESVGEELFSYIEKEFELYDYIENAELSRYILPAHLTMLEDKDIKKLACEFGII